MPNKPNSEQLDAENEDLRVRLEKAEESLRQILSGEADALFVSGAGGGQLFALKGTNQSYRTLIENMSEGALTLTPEGLVLYANRRFAEMLGMPLEKVIGSEIYNWIAPESRQVLQTLLRKEAVDNRREELVLAAADGTQVPVYLSVSRLVLDGMPDSFCMVATDLTEQKRNEAILAAESLARAILEQAADAIIICDENGRILRASKQAQAFCGNNPVGQLFEHAFPLRQPDSAAFVPISAIDTSGHQSADVRLEFGGQEFDFLVSAGHLKDAQSKLRGSVITLTDITERKTHELALMKIGRQLSEALTIAKIGYWEYEYATDQFIFNDQYYLLHKITAEEAGGYRMSSADFARRYVHPEDAPMVARNVRLAFDTPDPYYFAKTETRILTGDGEILWVEVRFRIQKDLHGNTIRLIGVNQDITERKWAEEALRTSEQRLELALDDGQIGVWDLDLVHDTSWRSLQHDQIFGYESLLPEWGQAIFLRHVVSEDRDRVSQCFEEAIRTGQLDFECQITRTDQERRWIRARGKVYRDQMDRPVRMLGTVIDITEHKRTEEQIHLQAERLTMTLESITDAFFTVDLKWRFTYLNREAERLLKRTRAELTGLELWTEFPDTIGSTFEREYRRAMADNKAVGFEEFYPPLNTWFDVRAYPSEQGLAVYFRDITEAKRTTEEVIFKNTILKTQQETSPDAILVVDENARIISYNQKFIAMWGLPLQMVSARNDAPVLKSVAEQVGNTEAFVARVRYLYEHPDDKSREEIKLKDGRVIDRYSAPITGANGKYYGRVWYFRDITERIYSDTALRESELRYHSLFENMLEGYSYCGTIFEQDKLSDFIYLEVNDAFGRLTGLTDVVGKKISDIIPGVQKDNAELLEMYGRVALTGQPEIVETYMPALGAWLSITVYSSDREHFVAVFENITERKNSQARILYLSRVHAVMSGINALIVRVQDSDELFREACRIVVENGGFRMALLIIVDPATKKVVSIASAGKDEELLTMVKDRLISKNDVSNTMVGMAISGKQPVVSNDSLNDRRVVFDKRYAESGIRSMVILPLIVADEVVGVISLYAGEIEFFHEEEMKLLTELAGDIAFAIDHIGKQEQLNYLAYYDALTGLANRSLFLERVAQYMSSAVSGGHKLAIGLVDLERFKNINDSLGRPAGDALLKQVAEWLTNKVGDANRLARIDADHFAIVLPEVKSDGNLAKLVENLLAAFLEHPFRLNDTVFRIGIKIGISVFPDDGADINTLFNNAEAALKSAKKSGDRYLFHTKKMTEAVAGKLTLENQLRQAIDNEEFVLYYQPKVNLLSGQVTGAEALLRWNDPRTGLVAPGMFIPVLEETGLISEVGRWALRQAITDYLRWRDAGLPAVRIAVNVSPLQLRNIDFIDEIRQVIAPGPHAAEGLELEITESMIMDDVQYSIDTLKAIRALGITIAIDDFGTGFSSLSYLAKLPVNTLKIDRSFVVEMDAPEGLALVSAIILVAHALKVKVVAEGVETEQQSRQLLSMGCDEMQGFLFSKAVPAEIFETRFLAQLPGG